MQERKVRFCPRRYNCKCHQNGTGLEGAALSVVAFTAKIASGPIIFTGRHSAPARQSGEFSLLAAAQVGGSVDAARTFWNAWFVRKSRCGRRESPGGTDTGMPAVNASWPLFYRCRPAQRHAVLPGSSMRRCWALTGDAPGWFLFRAFSAMAKTIGFNADEAAKEQIYDLLREFARWQAWPVTKSALILLVVWRVRWTHSAPPHPR